MVIYIAEIGINHNGSMNLAHELIRQAAMSGADVAKFQAYSVDALFGPNGEDPNEEIYKGVKPLEFNKEQFAQLKAWCEEESIEFMCSVFDEERLGWMEELGVKRHKIASRVSKLNRGLAEKMLATGKECYMSLGFGSTAMDKPYDNVKYLHCVAQYPTEYKNVNLPPVFGADQFYYGFSDHSLGIEASLVAIARGAQLIEKHFTLSKATPGFDHICSITPGELELMVKWGNQMSKIVNLSK
jgi:N-acetylneuraminate synthase/N,N'-diacetyllegionaminate synthase